MAWSCKAYVDGHGRMASVTILGIPSHVNLCWHLEMKKYFLTGQIYQSYFYIENNSLYTSVYTVYTVYIHVHTVYTHHNR